MSMRPRSRRATFHSVSPCRTRTSWNRASLMGSWILRIEVGKAMISRLGCELHQVLSVPIGEEDIPLLPRSALAGGGEGDGLSIRRERGIVIVSILPSRHPPGAAFAGSRHLAKPEIGLRALGGRDVRENSVRGECRPASSPPASAQSPHRARARVEGAHPPPEERSLHECDQGTVRGVGGAELARGRVGQLLHPAARDLEAEDLRSAIALALEHDELAVGTEAGRSLEGGVRGEPSQISAGRVHQIEIAVSRTLRREDDALSVRRPGRIRVVREVRGEALRAGAVGSEGYDVPVPCAIRLECQRPGRAGLASIYGSESEEESGGKDQSFSSVESRLIWKRSTFFIFFLKKPVYSSASAFCSRTATAFLPGASWMENDRATASLHRGEAVSPSLIW